ncbi:CBL-interacting protein kinase [Sesamum angolense]|uniref:non-specific serine/threonine protein kinase n=1 Tax=Sesamum angolense TaxID=2727404 RepID=A0AAE1T797_9LAMI|nr:CBL-interacting protein kinase [Sesamum angolense]
MVLLHARKGGSGGGGSKKEEEVVLPGRANTGMRLGKYELGRTLGEGNFGKVKYARNLESGQPFAIKILEKNRILDLKITDQIKREIGTLKLLKHPNVVRLYEVLASKAKIYMVLEYVNGGELFERILENVLIDASGNIKITDFGLSALLNISGPNYVAPEILSNKGYDGASSDTWSCGVILYVILTGYLPFDDRNLAVLYQKPSDGERDPDSPTLINAFQLIGMSSCLDLSGFFEKEDVSERKIRFTSHHSPKELLDRIENTVMQMGFHVQKKNGKMLVLNTQMLSNLLNNVNFLLWQVFEISPSLYVVELQKAYGDPLVYRQSTISSEKQPGGAAGQHQFCGSLKALTNSTTIFPPGWDEKMGLQRYACIHGASLSYRSIGSTGQGKLYGSSPYSHDSFSVSVVGS